MYNESVYDEECVAFEFSVGSYSVTLKNITKNISSHDDDELSIINDNICKYWCILNEPTVSSLHSTLSSIIGMSPSKFISLDTHAFENTCALVEHRDAIGEVVSVNFLDKNKIILSWHSRDSLF